MARSGHNRATHQRYIAQTRSVTPEQQVRIEREKRAFNEWLVQCGIREAK